MRVVPKEQETINETWLSDRDRFSYLGLNNKARATEPMIKRDGLWHVVDWQTALKAAAAGLAHVIKHHGPEQVSALSSPSSTLEESYLLQKLMRDLGVHNLDHRLQQTDFRDQHGRTVLPSNTLAYAEIENQDAVLLVGCNIAREVPLASIRVRKAQVNGGAIFAINPVDYDYHFAVAEKIIVAPQDMPMHLARIVLALVDDVGQLTEEIQRLLLGLTVDEKARTIATALRQPKAVIVSGALVENHPDAALLRTMMTLLARFSGARLLAFTAGSNSAGACLAGMLPHRSVAGKAVHSAGLDVQAALDAKLKGYFLMGVEPEFDFANPYRTRQSMLAAEFVVVLSAFQNESIKEYANVILPIAPYAETSGTYINVDATWQTVKGALAPAGEARPAWKVLRVLANLMHCDGFEYSSSEDVLEEVRSRFTMKHDIVSASYYPESLPVSSHQLVRVGEWPLYRSDAIVRHATALQTCASAEIACVRMHPDTANRLDLGTTATVSQGDIEITLPLERDERVALDVVWVANAMPETVDLGDAFAAIVIKQ